MNKIDSLDSNEYYNFINNNNRNNNKNNICHRAEIKSVVKEYRFFICFERQFFLRIVFFYVLGK